MRLEREIGDTVVFILVSIFVVGLFFCGVAAGTGAGQTAVKNHACRAACLHVGSVMESQSGNLCTCRNLRTMSGDYSQMFLRGTSNE